MVVQLTASTSDFATSLHSVVDNVGRIIRGKQEVIELAVICLFAEGHLLIEDVPGLGKTTLARALAISIGGRMQRIQFTPDLLASDVVGVSIYHPAQGSFAFHPGPVFANIVHADEINRASPKTQSALLEVMQERQVTVDGAANVVPRPFMVIATQNPIEMDGTFPLPEAQLDRFLMRLPIGYPDHDAEVAVLRGTSADGALAALDAVMSAAAVADLIAVAEQIHVADALYDYIVDVVGATRDAPGVRLGASPRASVGLLRAVRVLAGLSNRDYVVPADVKALARHVLAHRILVTAEAELRGRVGASVVEEVLARVPVPVAAGR
jgi:MoxR-like ATPase